MDVQNHTSCLPYGSKSEDRNSELNELPYAANCDQEVSLMADAVSNDVKDKLHITCSANSGLLNGCSKLHDDVINVEFPINGLTKCHNLERIAISSGYIANDCASVESNVCKGSQCTDAPSPLPPCDTENRSNDVRSVADASSRELSITINSTELAPQTSSSNAVNIMYIGYESENQMPDIMRLIQKDLSEPYSIYTYRYFIHNWPKLCFLAQDGNKCVGAIVCKLDVHKKHSRRGYIAMLAVHEMYRKRKIGSNLVLKAIKAMVQDNADEVVLETEITNKPALRLYENLGFVRDKRLFRYYLNGVDALRLKLWLR